MKRPFFALLLSTQLAATLLVAQETPQVPPLVEKIDVRVINLDVVVTDRKGNIVRGLKKDDFEVVENGRLQPITNFYEVAGDGSTTEEAAPPEAKPAEKPAAPSQTRIPEHLRRRIILYIDNLSLAPFNRNRVFTSMKKFIRESMRPGDEAMVVTWNRDIKIRVPFTDDPTQIEQALDGIAGESSFGLQNLSERRDVETQIREARSYADAIAAARTWAQSVEHDLRQSVTALNGLMSTLAGVEGKKILVLTSEGFPIQPGKEMFFFIDEMKREKTSWRTGGSSLIEGMAFDSSTLIQSLARAANANGVTLYALHAGGLNASNEAAADNSKPLPFAVQQAALSNSTDSLNLLADLTGGRATIGTNNFQNAFANIERDLSSYYSLGYRSGTQRVDRQRSVQVRAKNRNYVVRARKSFVEKSVSTEMNDRVVANLFYPTKSNDMNITVITGTPEQIEVDRFRLPLEIRIPMSSLTLIPQGEIFSGGFTVYVVVGNKDNDMSDVVTQAQRLQIPPSDMETLAGRYYTYKMTLIVEKGRNKVSVGVVDEVGNMTGFDRREVLAADLR